MDVVLQPGARLAGKYEIMEKIGAGGMGVVYRAIQHPLGTEVCVKTLHQHIVTDDPSFALRFEREARTLASLRHPNIVAVLDFGSDQLAASFIVMEYVTGENLRNLLKNTGPLKAPRAVRVIGQVCDALSAAHAQGVIHRDLKPSNIVVGDLPGQPDFVKVLDFGSVLIMGADAEERLTRAGMVIGTPIYMAPEYIMGRAIDPRVDVYAAGVMLYVLVCGTAPFRGVAQALFAQHVGERPPRPTEKNPNADVSPQMERVIMRALEKDPDVRYQSAADLKAAMEEALSSRGDERIEVEIAIDENGPEWAESLQMEPDLPAPDRHVAVVVVRGVHGLPETVAQRLVNLGNSKKALVQAGRAAVALAFVVDMDREGAVVEAARFAATAAKAAGQPVRLGLHVGGWAEESPPTDMETGVVEQVKARADSLAAAAVPGQVLVSESNARYLAEISQLRPAAPPPGIDEPVFDVTGADPTRQIRHRLPFVGRELERNALLEFASSARNGRVCLVSGTEGVGKSRLVEELTEEADKQGVLWAVVPATPHQRRGYAHPAALLAARGLKGRPDADSGASGPISDLLMGKSDTTSETGIHGRVAQERLVTAAVGWLVDRAAEGPVVIVLDDLQEADDLTLALARRLVEMAGHIGASAVLCARDPANVPVWLPPDVLHIPLPPLDHSHVRAMMEQILGPSADARLSNLAGELAQGMPLLAHLLLPFLQAGEVTVLDRVRGRSPGEGARELIRIRLESLSAEALNLLYAAALLGYESSEKELLNVTGVGEEGVPALNELETAEQIIRLPGGRVRFPFPTLWRVAVAAVPRAERRRYHTAAADMIIQSEAAEIRAMEIGEHLLEADDFKRAYSHLAKAAEHAEAEGEFREAIWCLQLAVEACHQLGGSHVTELLGAYRDLARVLLQVRDLEKADEVLRTGLNRAQTGSAVPIQTDMLRLHGRLAVLAGDTLEGRNRFEAAFSTASQAQEVVAAAQACADLADTQEQMGDPKGSGDTLRRGLGLVRDRQDSDALEARLRLLKRLGRLEQRARNYSTAVFVLTEALHLAELRQDRYEMAGLLGNLGSAYARQNDMAKAVEFTERALKQSEDLGDLVGVSRQTYNMALINLRSGREDDAMGLLRESRDIAVRAGWHKGFAMCEAALAQLGNRDSSPSGSY